MALRNRRRATVFVAPLLASLLFPAGVASGERDELVKGMDVAQMTLGKAIATAEAESQGRAIAAHARFVAKALTIDVHVLVGDKCLIVPIDGKTAAAGKTTDATAKDEKADHAGKAADIVKGLDDAKLTLVKVVTAAELESKGKATAVVATEKDGKTQFVVYCVVDGKYYSVTVDGATGKVTKTEEKKPDEKKEEKKRDKKKPGPDKQKP